MYSLSFELVYGAFFFAAAVDYYVYYTVPCFFGLFLLTLFLSPLALELKYEVGVWMKRT